MRRWLEGYDRNSVIAFAILATTYAVVIYAWRELFDFTRTDWLLVGIWIAMTAVLCWRIEPGRDTSRALAGLAGGLAIEAWGTVTRLWAYSTFERPPLWIIPAWPVATLAIDRLARFMEPRLPVASERRVRLVLAAFVCWMGWFARHSFSSVATWLACGAMCAVVISTARRVARRDASLFAAGSALGVLLEYWGTSRGCWTYWTKEIPPLVTVFAHGFASVAFQRLIDGTVRVGQMLQRRTSVATQSTASE